MSGKEMYSFQDWVIALHLEAGGNRFCGAAALQRLLSQVPRSSGIQGRCFATSVPMGRQRQFHQIGVEWSVRACS